MKVSWLEHGKCRYEGVGSPFMHEKNMRTSRDIRVNGHGEDEFIVFPVEVIEVVLHS